MRGKNLLTGTTQKNQGTWLCTGQSSHPAWAASIRGMWGWRCPRGEATVKASLLHNRGGKGTCGSAPPRARGCGPRNMELYLLAQVARASSQTTLWVRNPSSSRPLIKRTQKAAIWHVFEKGTTLLSSLGAPAIAKQTFLCNFSMEGKRQEGAIWLLYPKNLGAWSISK